MVTCKKCGSDDLSKNGTTPTDSGVRLQKYICNDCGHHFKTTVKGAPKITGIIPEERLNFEDEILPYMIKLGERAKEKTILEKQQVIEMPDGPFAICLLSDIHGGGKIDYKTLAEDLTIIEETEDLYSIVAGDATDNFIIGVLQSIQKDQPTTHQMEERFVRWFIEKQKSKILAWCSGNHDNWTKKLSGIDYVRKCLNGVKCLYDRNQVQFVLKWGDNHQKWMVRHKWRNNSVFNCTHGIEVGWERVGVNFDIGIGAHTHIASLCRTFIREERKRFAILLGTYKLRDDFGRQEGFPQSVGTGSGAFVYHPDGRVFWCEDLKTAKDVLSTWKQEYNKHAC